MFTGVAVMAYLTAKMTTALTSGIVTDHRKIVNTEVRTPIFISSNFDHKIFTMHTSDLLSNGLIVQTRHRCKRLFTSLPHVYKAIRISEYGKFLLVESRILGFGIRNTVLQESGIQVPLTKIWNPVLESEIHRMESRTQTCLGATISFSPVNEKVPIMQALIFPMHTSEDMPDRWIMKVYSPGTPHGMVMKTFIRRTRPSICLSKERSRHVLPTIPLSD